VIYIGAIWKMNKLELVKPYIILETLNPIGFYVQTLLWPTAAAKRIVGVFIAKA
jgi:hypothetical protein